MCACNYLSHLRYARSMQAYIVVHVPGRQQTKCRPIIEIDRLQWVELDRTMALQSVCRLLIDETKRDAVVVVSISISGCLFAKQL